MAEMVQGRPEDNDLDRSYEAALMFDANRAAYQAFPRGAMCCGANSEHPDHPSDLQDVPSGPDTIYDTPSSHPGVPRSANASL